MSAVGPAPLAPTYAWCQSCGLRYALALPKRPRLCGRCGGSNPEDEGGAPEEARQERTDHRYVGGPAGRTPRPIRAPSPAADRCGRRARRQRRARHRRATSSDHFKAGLRRGASRVWLVSTRGSRRKSLACGPSDPLRPGSSAAKASVVSVRRSSGGAARQGSDGGRASRRGSGRILTTCQRFAAATTWKSLVTQTGKVVSTRTAAVPSWTQRMDQIRRGEVIAIVAPAMALGVRMLRAPAAGRCLDDFRRRESSDRRLATVAADAPWPPKATTRHRLSRSRLNE